MRARRLGRPPNSPYSAVLTAKLPRALIYQIHDFADAEFTDRTTAIEMLLSEGLAARRTKEIRK